LNRRYMVVHTPRLERNFRRLSPELQERIGEYRVIYEIRDQRIILHAVGSKSCI